MLKRSSIKLLTFVQLLCGEGIKKFMQTEEQCQQVIGELRKLAPDTPLPLPVASAYAICCVKNRKYRDAVITIASSLQPRELIEEVENYFQQHMREFSLNDMKEMAVLLRQADIPEAALFLGVLAKHCTSDSHCSDLTKSEVRQMILSHIRFAPSSIFILLRPLCLLSSSSASNHAEIVEVVRIGVRDGYINPADFAVILGMLLDHGDYSRIVAQWRWMRYTSAQWDQTAASASICAFARLGQIEEAIASIQSLSEADLDPTIDAQCAVMRLLSNRTASLAHYAERLMGHWHPHPHLLWTSSSRAVGVGCIFALFSVGMHRDVLRLLNEAAECVQDAAEHAQGLLKCKGIHLLMRRYAVELNKYPSLEALFFDSVKNMLDLAEYPLVMAAFLFIGIRQGRISECYEVLTAASLISNDSFDEFIQFLVRSLQKDRPADILNIITEVSQRLQKELPLDIITWFELLGERQ